MGADFVCRMEEVLDGYEQPDNATTRSSVWTPRQLRGERRKSFTDEYGVEHVDYK
ncbi:MAG: hypothetical protein HC877_15810 [Thioploca sp.]|nr:hypothetical protein [Thioploca sp.]